MRRLCWMVAIGMVLFGACQEIPEPTVSLTQEQWKKIRTQVLDTRPMPQHPVGAVFGVEGKPLIELVGYDVSGSLVTGKPITITWYWHAIEQMDRNWKVFVHLRPKQGNAFQNLDHHPVEGLFQTSLWEPGSFIRDAQTVTLQAGFPSGGGWLDGGLFDERGGSRMQLLDANGLESVEEDKLRFGDVTTKNNKVLKIPLVEEAPAMDGNIDEPLWRIAPSTGAFVGAGDGSAVSFSTTAKVVYTRDALYFAFDARDRDIRTRYKARDDELWNEDCVEIYLNPDSDDGSYWELQISPGAGPGGKPPLFDAYFETHRKPHWKESRNRQLRGLEAAVRRTGTLNSSGTRTDDTRYTIEVKVPFAGLLSTPGATRRITGVSNPPKVGDTWRINLFRVEHGYSGASLSTQHSAWSPAGGDFHNLAAFGLLEFGPARTIPGPRKTSPRKTGGTGPKLEMKTMGIAGNVQPRFVNQAIQQKRAPMQDCMDTMSLAVRPEKRNEGIFKMGLDPTGQVIKVERPVDFLTPEAVECVAEQLLTWRVRVPPAPKPAPTPGQKKKPEEEKKPVELGFSVAVTYVPATLPNAPPGGVPEKQQPGIRKPSPVIQPKALPPGGKPQPKLSPKAPGVKRRSVPKPK